MSEANLEVGTGEFLREAVHPHFVWDTTTFRGGIDPETCVGVDEANRWLAQWLGGFENWSLDVEGTIDAVDLVVTVVRQHANPRSRKNPASPAPSERLGPRKCRFAWKGNLRSGLGHCPRCLCFVPSGRASRKAVTDTSWSWPRPHAGDRTAV